jgi:hypothetical protein
MIICGQGFTRKHSGSRHNSNLHSGTAKLVRPFDYVIGRLNGEIASPMHDPLFYRRYKGKIIGTNNRRPLRKTTNGHITNSHNDNKPDDNLNKIQNRSSKFEELKTLLYKYCCPQDAYRRLTVVNFQIALDGNEDF